MWRRARVSTRGTGQNARDKKGSLVLCTHCSGFRSLFFRFSIFHSARLVRVKNLAAPVTALYSFGGFALTLDARGVLQAHRIARRRRRQNLQNSTADDSNDDVDDADDSEDVDAVDDEDAPARELTVGAGATCILHPDTMLNKILIGYESGVLRLWNLRSCKLVYEFAGWGSKVTW